MLPSRYLDSCHANEGQGSSVSSYSAQTDCAASISVAVNEGRRWALASNNADNFQSFEFRLSTVRKMWPANKNTAPVDHTAPFYGTFITRDAASWHFMFFRPISCNKCQPNIGPHSTAPSGCYAKINRPRFQSAKDNATSIASKVSMSSRVSLSLSLSLWLTHLSSVFAISVAGTELRAEEMAIELPLSTLVNSAIQSSVSSLMERCLVWSPVRTVGVD